MTGAAQSSSRWSFPQSGLGVAAAAVLLVACSTAEGATARPTARSTASATPQPFVDLGCHPNVGDACVGWLSAGKHSTTFFEDPFTFVVPAGWADHADSAGEYVLLAPGSHPGPFDSAPWNWIAIEANVTLTPEGCPPSGTDVFDRSKTAADIASWMTRRAHLVTTQPERVTLSGLDGVTIDVRLAKDAPTECMDFPAVFLVHGVGASDGYDQGVGPVTAERFYFFDHGDDVLMIELDDQTGGSRLDEFSAVVKTIKFVKS